MPVTIDQARIDGLVDRPTESLNVEVKRWVNPDEPEGEAKIAKAALAIRNRNGGFLIIGFDNETFQPVAENKPDDVSAKFHPDRIQLIVSRYASELFEVAVGFGMRDGVEYPVIVVPEGVRVPTAAKADLRDAKGKLLIRLGEIYFRTLGSNGTVSTAAARAPDWRDIVEICFENCEADIGRFFRRHLGDRDISALLARLSTGTVTIPPQRTIRDRVETLLNEGERRYLDTVKKRQLDAEDTKELDAGTCEVSLVVDPPREEGVANSEFLQTFAAANPNYTGWPIWVDSRGFVDPASLPKVVDKGWQSLIISLAGWSKHVDFMRVDPKGEFYLLRVLQDDFTDRVDRGTALDAVIVVLRTAEAIAVGLSVVKATGWPVEGTTLGFGFRWTRLSGRELTSWANPMVGIRPNFIAEDDRAETFVGLPLDTPVSAIAPYVEKVANDLFRRFAGYQMRREAIEEWVQRLIERRL